MSSTFPPLLKPLESNLNFSSASCLLSVPYLFSLHAMDVRYQSTLWGDLPNPLLNSCLRKSPQIQPGQPWQLKFTARLLYPWSPLKPTFYRQRIEIWPEWRQLKFYYWYWWVQDFKYFLYMNFLLRYIHAYIYNCMQIGIGI